MSWLPFQKVGLTGERAKIAYGQIPNDDCIFVHADSIQLRRNEKSSLNLLNGSDGRKMKSASDRPIVRFPIEAKVKDVSNKVTILKCFARHTVVTQIPDTICHQFLQYFIL